MNIQGTAKVTAFRFDYNQGDLVIVCTDGSIIVVDVPEDTLTSLFRTVDEFHE